MPYLTATTSYTCPGCFKPILKGHRAFLKKEGHWVCLPCCNRVAELKKQPPQTPLNKDQQRSFNIDRMHPTRRFFYRKPHTFYPEQQVREPLKSLLIKAWADKSLSF